MTRTRTCMTSLLMVALMLCAACESPPSSARGFSSKRAARNAVHDYYHHRYPDARDTLRLVASDRRDKNVVLNNLRLGAASLADGDHFEAESSLLRAYEYLVSGGVNARDREVGSTVVHEGIRVWKGEPYEQAMAFYHIAVLYMLKGDWENARAAANNSLFALRDFEGHPDGRPRDMEEIAEEAARAERQGERDYLDNAYRRVESQWVLGYLLAAVNKTLAGRPEDAAREFDHVKTLRPDLGQLAEVLRSGSYDTLLLIDEGHGPTKEAYGRDGASVRYVPDGRTVAPPRVRVRVNGKQVAHAGVEPVVDLWTLSQNPRWWSLESIRHAKSVLGDVFLVGGATAAHVGSQRDNEAAQWAGIAAVLAGMAMKATAEADTRHLETLPRCVYLVPLRLGNGRNHVQVHFEGAAGSDATWHDLRGGATSSPSVYYLRMHNGGGTGMPAWPNAARYSVNVDGYAGGPPWVMGGFDLTPPSPAIVKAYHERGVLRDMNMSSLTDLYRGEGFVFTPGPQGRTDGEALNPVWYRHVVEGGRVLFAPPPGTYLYQRLTRTNHGAYELRGAVLRSIIQPPPAGRGQP